MRWCNERLRCIRLQLHLPVRHLQRNLRWTICSECGVVDEDSSAMRDGGDGIFTYILLQVMICAMCPVSGLRDVHLSLPVALLRGARVKLSCDYDLEDAQLYSLKWYRGDQEFFRFVPRDDPPTQVFPHPGINVDVSLSGARGVVLSDVQPGITGVFKCEVSADAPLFHTVIKEAAMVVVDPPEDIPKLSIGAGRLQFSPGEVLRANCTSPPSFPPANLTWFIDGRQVPDYHVRRYPTGDGASVDAGKLLVEPDDGKGGGEDGRGKEEEKTERTKDIEFQKSIEEHLTVPLKETSILGLELRLDNATPSVPTRPMPPPVHLTEESGNRHTQPVPSGGTLLRLRCLATLFTLYRRTTEIEVVVMPSSEDNSPKIAPVLHEEAQQASKSSGSWVFRPTFLHACMANGLLCLCGWSGLDFTSLRASIFVYFIGSLGCDSG